MFRTDDVKYNNIINKLSIEVKNAMSDPDFINTHEDGLLHTENIHRCCRGDNKAKQYVLNNIEEIVNKKIKMDEIDYIRKVLNELVENIERKIYEVNSYINKNPFKETKITLNELIKYFLKSNNVSSFFNNKIPQRHIAQVIYNFEYGNGLLEPLFDMRLNNIEVHGTHKIRIELDNGIWCTIDDYKFDTDEEIKIIAQRLLNQDNGSDLTEEDCEREGALLDGTRIAVALKPASSKNTIFLKKFDSFTPNLDNMLENGFISKEILHNLRVITKGRGNVVMFGGVNVGKSTFTKFYAGLYPLNFKIGLLDSSKDTDLESLYPERDIITLFETDKYSLNDQFSKLLRMNRDILAISEARSFEIEQMLKAMSRGNSGSFCTLHSTTVEDLVDSVAYMCLENGVQQDMKALRNRIASTIDFAYRIRYDSLTGNRYLDEISEIVATGDLDNPYHINKMYYWDYKENKVVRNKSYYPSDKLISKLMYFGCTEDEINILKGENK